MGIIADRLRGRGGRCFEATNRFVSIAVQHLDDIALKDFTAREPKLASYAFLCKSAWGLDADRHAKFLIPLHLRGQTCTLVHSECREGVDRCSGSWAIGS